MRAQEIPSNYYVAAKVLHEKGFSYSDLKRASMHGGILDRWRSPKTRRVFYRSRNYALL
jgi:hypothetical protein